MTREDKEAIIRRIEVMYKETEGNGDKEALFYAIEALKEPRTQGEWIKQEWVDPRLVKYKCSVCEEKVTNFHPNFCPNCGADMRKEGDEK